VQKADGFTCFLRGLQLNFARLRQELDFSCRTPWVLHGQDCGWAEKCWADCERARAKFRPFDFFAAVFGDPWRRQVADGQDVAPALLLDAKFRAEKCAAGPAAAR
jgi:hypothetical protein